MGIFEILLTAVALSMDASAAAITDGALEPKMRIRKMLLIALFFGAFQGLMPLIGYYAGSVFSKFIASIAPYVALVLLGFMGGKMLYDAFKKDEEKPPSLLGVGTITMQAVATSIDALAVGISLLALSASGSLVISALWCCAIFTVITFALSFISVLIGKKFGTLLADKAELTGGIILIVIGLKIFIEGVFF